MPQAVDGTNDGLQEEYPWRFMACFARPTVAIGYLGLVDDLVANGTRRQVLEKHS